MKAITPMLAEAITLAADKHRHQVRKVSGLPYITHLSGVALLVKTFKKSKNLESLVCAAYLHDTLEDTDTTYEELESKFGPMVAGLVKELTNEPYQGPKWEYLARKMVKMSSYALTLKLCDRLQNLLDFPSKETVDETIDIMGYLLPKRVINKTQQAIVTKIFEITDNYWKEESGIQ